MALNEAKLDPIIRRCQAGDRAAYSELFRIIKVDVARIMYSTIGASEEHEDLVQVALLELFRSIPRFQWKSKFSTWLYRLVVNVGLQHIRKKKNQSPSVDIDEMGDLISSDGPSPYRNLENRERLKLVNDILDDMPPKKRTVLVLHEFEGMTPEEISKIVGASKLTVKSRLFYARKDFYRKLRQKMVINDANVQYPDNLPIEE